MTLEYFQRMDVLQPSSTGITVYRSYYVIYKVNRDFTREEFKQQFGPNTYPRVVVENEVLGGFLETVQYLREQKLV